MKTSTTDRIEKKILLKAPRARVWRALTEAEEFGAWFGVDFAGKGTFAPGRRIQGQILHKNYRHVTMDITIESMEPERLVSWRWHPHAVERGRDYSKEPTTLVVFELEAVRDGTLLTVTETGFDRIPAERRAEAFRGNDAGWAAQTKAIQAHLERAA